MEKSWITDRKPEKAGNYWVTLEYPIGRWNSKTEKFEQRENVEHISLADWADVFVLAPASANTISKITQGTNNGTKQNNK